MIKVKNYLITKELIDVLEQLIEQDISATPAFKLTRLLKELSSIFEDKFKTEKRIFDKYLIRDENGQLVLGTDESGNQIEGTYIVSDVNSFNQEMKELMEVENELNYTKMKFEDLGLQTAKIKDLMKIEFLFE
jgi:hypothetical protein